MSEISTKKFTYNFGTISYYRTVKVKLDYDILFIHGLGGNKKWFLSQFERYNLDYFSWIIPDLCGYGESSKPFEIEIYSMDNQASTLLNLLVSENVESLVILAHSMGGPIAISLIEQLKQTDCNINVLRLFYMEGNLDVNDAFFSSKIAKYSLKEFKENFKTWLGNLNENADDKLREFFKELDKIGPIPLWASSIDLVSISESNQLLPRLQAATQAHNNCLVHFIFGEGNKGLFTSEKLVEKSQLPLIYIPKAGHTMHQDNPNAFWTRIKQLLP